MTITVKYSCADCGLAKAHCDVPARGDEGVVTWLEQVVMFRIRDDHQRRSPGCPAKGVQDLMIPTAGTDRVGGPSLQ